MTMSTIKCLADLMAENFISYTSDLKVCVGVIPISGKIEFVVCKRYIISSWHIYDALWNKKMHVNGTTWPCSMLNNCKSNMTSIMQNTILLVLFIQCLLQSIRRWIPLCALLAQDMVIEHLVVASTLSLLREDNYQQFMPRWLRCLICFLQSLMNYHC